MFTKDPTNSKSSHFQLSKPQMRSYIETCQSHLHSLARTRIPTKLQAQIGVSDLVQETCLRAYRHLSSFRGTTHQQFGAWLQSILHHQILNLFKRLYYKIEPNTIHQTFPVQRQCQSAYHEETPSHILMNQEEQEIMNLALEQLTSEERHILARHHRDALTFAELGAELQCSEEAARKRWARALLRWKRLVQSSHA